VIAVFLKIFVRINGGDKEKVGQPTRLLRFMLLITPCRIILKCYSFHGLKFGNHEGQANSVSLH